MRLPFLALALPVACLVQLQAQPKLALDSAHHDFGRIAPNLVVTHRFKASNAGDAPLTIARLAPACGCTSAVVGKATLAPGESTELEVTFNAAGASGPTRKSVEVVSNDPAGPAALTFEADVIPAASPSSDEIWFEDLVPADHPMASVKVATGTAQAIRLDDVQLSEAPWLGVVTRLEGKDLWVDFDLLASRLPPDRPSGTDTVTLHVANPNHSAVKLSVHWVRRAPAAP